MSPYIAAETCKTAGCSEPVKRNRKGWGMGHCAVHVLGTVTRVRPVGSRAYSTDGYVNVKLEDGRIIGEHRIVMERQLGRPLVQGETVHHINGVRDDNRPENLEIWYSPQPYGQRVEDLIEYVVAHHGSALLAALEATDAVSRLALNGTREPWMPPQRSSASLSRPNSPLRSPSCFEPENASESRHAPPPTRTENP